MKIAGTRPDGALYLTVGGGLAVILKGKHVTPTLDESVVETMGPWTSVGTVTFDNRRAITLALDLARVASLDTFRFDTAAQAAQYRLLLSTLGDDPVLQLADPAHPFTYCKEHIVPKMTEKGHAPDDPDAFCAWWKSENG